MKVLIVEDDDFKAKALTEFMEVEATNYEISVATNLSVAIKLINENAYFLVLVDMAIPSHELIHGEGAPISHLTGGLEVILELNYLKRENSCVVITQYPDIEISEVFYPVDQAAEAIKDKLCCDVKGCIRYIDGDETWKTDLRKYLI